MDERPDKNEVGSVSLVPGYKSLCTRLWLVMIVVFGVRIAANLLLGDKLNSFSGDKRTIAEVLYAVVFLNVIPILASVFILKFNVKSESAKIYVKPKYFGRALGIFPAGYGLAMSIALITALIGMAVERGTGLGDSFHATDKFIERTTILSGCIHFFHAVVLAPLFEEFWFRGVIMQSVRPYGNGVAIFVSAIMFGLTHANFSQVFYATAIGIIFGYVAIQTGSIYTSMALHAMFNTPASITRMMMTDEKTAEAFAQMAQGEALDQTEGATVLIVWEIVISALSVIGLIMAIVKLTRIKRYKVPKVQEEISAPRRWGILLTRATFFIMLIPAVYVFFRMTPQDIQKLFSGYLL